MPDHLALTQQISRRNIYILVALWSFIFGILLASLISVPPMVCILIIAIALVIYFAERHVIILIALCALSLGAFRYDIKDFHELLPAGSSGVVVSEPDHRDADTRFVVKTDTREKVLVTTDLLSTIEYGDEVELIGSAKLVKPGSYADYLSKDEIFYTENAKVTKSAETSLPAHGQEGNSRSVMFRLTGLLLKIKGAFVERIKNILPEPESSLLAGLIVSGKQALAKDILDEFRRAGVVHIVVLSGYNITVIAEFLFLLFGFLGSRRAASASAVGVILFTLMSGASATVVRGAIMVLLVLLGRIIHRPGNTSRILLFTAFVMLFLNPKLLVFDPSFQLSFLALLGLIYGTPLVEKLFASHGQKGDSRQIAFRLRELISATLATQIFVFPYLLYNMGNFSLVFLLSNLLILPILPFVMLVGFIAALLAFISNILAWPLAFASHLLLAWILGVAHFLGNLSFASIQIENFPLWGSLLLYTILGFIFWQSRNSFHKSASLG